MTQATIAIANGSGAAVRAAVNSALEAMTTKQSGGTAPATTYPFMEWADTGNDLLKQRNAANSAWIIKGTLSAEYGGLPASGISYAPGSPAQLSASNVQEAIDELKAAIDDLGVPVFTKSFESAENTITAGGSLAWEHGLGEEPKIVQAVLVCKTAEGGYSVGDQVAVNNSLQYVNTPNTRGQAIRWDSANIYVRFGSDPTTYTIINAGNGQVLNITLGNWRFVVRAYA